MNPKTAFALYRAQTHIKVLASRAFGRLRPRKDILNLRFYRDTEGWFVDLPSWPGPKAALAMVDGADIFLERLGNRAPEVRVQVSMTEKPETEGWFTLNYVAPHVLNDGAYYRTLKYGRAHDMWLCGVTEFVLGRMPSTIYVRKSIH